MLRKIIILQLALVICLVASRETSNGRQRQSSDAENKRSFEIRDRAGQTNSRSGSARQRKYDDIKNGGRQTSSKSGSASQRQYGETEYGQKTSGTGTRSRTSGRKSTVRCDTDFAKLADPSYMIKDLQELNTLYECTVSLLNKANFDSEDQSKPIIRPLKVRFSLTL